MAQHDAPMTKADALRLLGGNSTTAARAIGCTPQAVRAWPDPLPPRIRDRVQAARWRLDEAVRRVELLEHHRRWAAEQELARHRRVNGKP